jgi:hypothetical protein
MNYPAVYSFQCYPSIILSIASICGNQSRVRRVKANAVTRGMDRLSSMGREEKSSVRDEMTAAAAATGREKENTRNIKNETTKKVNVPSRDFPNKCTLPNLPPSREDRGSAMERIKRDETAIFFSKNMIVIRPERI